ncbi:MAG: peptidoglycan DD-metalloendopeptidase family protein [Leptolinea sp.]|nr:peptidoglycan DD-metalloendopeptidase family protein [Leptolinea sp.]
MIASKFGVSAEEIIAVNKIENPNFLTVGNQIIIPGLEGVTGNLTAEVIPLGSTLDGLSIQHQFPISMLTKLNKITSPQEIFAGSSLILPVSDQASLRNVQILRSGEALSETSVRINLNPWIVAIQNNLDETWQAIPSRPLYYSSSAPDNNQPNSILPNLKNLQFDELPLTQGHTVEITASGEPGLQVSGHLNGYTLHFFSTQDGRYLALQGIYAMTEPGLVNFDMTINKADSESYSFSQRILVQSGYYPEDPMLSVDPATIDPAVVKPEEDQIRKLASQVTPQQLWSGKFRDPVDEPICYKSTFGNRRAYNGGPYSSFHAGLDYGVCANLNIYAPAAGVVVFAGPLTVRGNSTIIDHGLGVFTGYWHQSEIKVNVGEHVEPGQLIGLIGDTGRVTGPHLHWEIWVNGAQVNPIQWLEKTYP